MEDLVAQAVAEVMMAELDQVDLVLQVKATAEEMVSKAVAAEAEAVKAALAQVHQEAQAELVELDFKVAQLHLQHHQETMASTHQVDQEETTPQLTMAEVLVMEAQLLGILAVAVVLEEMAVLVLEDQVLQFFITQQDHN